MAMFTWPFPANPAAPLLLGLMALAVVAITAVMLAAGLVNLQANLQVRTVQAQNVAADRAALVALYDATGGDSWTNNTGWKSDDPLGDWHGVTTNANGRVTSLLLENNTLTGTIPAELGRLSSLSLLALYNNTLTGSIPAELGDLRVLTTLNLYDNTLTGSIPTELGRLNTLTHLNVRRNTLTGPIPSELGGLSNLRVLALDNNNLMGTVPTELGQLSKMTNLSLEHNALTGQFPSSFTGLAALKVLSFQSNAGLCAPLDSAFQTWLRGVSSRQGDNCPPAAIRAAAAAPVAGEPVTVRLTYREALLARIQATSDEYANNPCIGYDTSGDRASITVPLWTWERADADSGDPNSPDDSTWASVTAGLHPNASFVYLPQDGDVGKFLRASLTYDSPETTVTTAAIGPVAADNGLTGEDMVDADVAGPLRVGITLGALLPAAANAERLDRAINPNPERWQWERSDDGSTGWTNVTPYHKHCEQPDSEYLLTSDDLGKFLNAYVYYNDDSSGSVVLKEAHKALNRVAP